MKIKRLTFTALDKVYSLVQTPIDNGYQPAGFAAASETDGPLLYFVDPEAKPLVLADSPGGYISMATWLHHGRPMLAVSTDFKPGFNAARCCLKIYPLDQGERPVPLADIRMPYTHRVAVVKVGPHQVLLASTLCSRKDFKEDWAHPGGVYAAAIPDKLSEEWSFKPIIEGLTYNHGLDWTRLGPNDPGGFLASADEGLFHLQPPTRSGDDWDVAQLAEGPHSDAWGLWRPVERTADIFCICPFHGNKLVAYRRNGRKWDRRMIDCPIELGHVVWAGPLLGAPALLIGDRRGRRALRLLRPVDASELKFEETHSIEEGIGPTQMIVRNTDEREAELIVAAHNRNEVVRYRLTV